MKIILNGINRRVYTHKHKIHNPNLATWHEFTTSIEGTVSNLELSGNFRIEFVFENTELEKLFEEYLDENPKKGLMLISKLQKNAIKKLISKTKDIE